MWSRLESAPGDVTSSRVISSPRAESPGVGKHDEGLQVIELRDFVMHVRRRFAGHLVLLAMLCLLISFNALTARISHASSLARHKTAKSTGQLLPKKRLSPSGVP